MRSASRRRLTAAAIPLATLLAGGALHEAGAVEVPDLGGKPLLVDITNTAVVAYHFNNRNDANLDPPHQVDDFYGEFLDRLNVQASWWRLRLGFRLDSAVYFHTLDRGGVAAIVKDQTPYIDAMAGSDPVARAKVVNETTNNFYDELHSRFLRAIYPSKLFIGYAQPGFDVTVGDFYVQLGRGLVFSVRKIDELAVDTTVRGVKAVFDRSIGDVQVGTMFFAGQMNPLRVDEASGRRLNGSGSPLFFGFPTGGALENYDITSQPGAVIDVIYPSRPSYLEDSAAGGKVDVSTKWFSLGANAAGLYRQSNTVAYLSCIAAGQNQSVGPGNVSTQNICGSRYPEFSSTDPSKEHNRILNWSGTVNVPSILKHGDLYVEFAGQSMRDGHLAVIHGLQSPQPDIDGYAVYASGSVTGGPVSVSLEGKNYRNFFPLSANIDITTPGFSAPEFSLVQYSQPPTAEPVYTEVVSGGSPGVCVTGGRARVDYRFNREASVYAWLGRYSSWTEIPTPIPSSGCAIGAASQTNIWDTATGLDLGFEKGRTHVKAWVGARTSEFEVTPAGALTDAFYREGYVRYDLIKHLTGPLSLQLQGWHRHRYEPVSFTKPWTEGENYTALQWSPHLSAIFGFEYFLREQCIPGRAATLSQAARASSDACYYVNGGLQWRSSTTWAETPKRYVAQLFDGVGLFVGQRRGATRCVSGVCRTFPPFEGARLEITSRF